MENRNKALAALEGIFEFLPDSRTPEEAKEIIRLRDIVRNALQDAAPDDGPDFSGYEPFVFDPATGFFHADDGGAPEHGVKWSRDNTYDNPVPSTLDWVLCLKHGHYIIHWRQGGCSKAVVGSTHDGTRWYACANWTSDNRVKPLVASCDWSNIERAEFVMSVPSPVADLETLKDEVAEHLKTFEGFSMGHIIHSARTIDYLNERGLIQPVEKIEGLDEAIEKHWMGAGDLGSQDFADRNNQCLPIDILLLAARRYAAMQRQS